METKRFTEMLNKLQALQQEAVLGGIESFAVEGHYYRANPDLGDEDDEYAIFVSVFLTGDFDDENDYLRMEFWESADEAEWFRMYTRLHCFVSNFINVK